MNGKYYCPGNLNHSLSALLMLSCLFHMSLDKMIWLVDVFGLKIGGAILRKITKTFCPSIFVGQKDNKLVLKIYLLLSKQISNLTASKNKKRLNNRRRKTNFRCQIQFTKRNLPFIIQFFFCRLRLVPAGSFLPLDSFGGGLRKQTLSRAFLNPNLLNLSFHKIKKYFLWEKTRFRMYILPQSARKN